MRSDLLHVVTCISNPARYLSRWRLYERFAPMVHGLLLARVPRADVDDLVHDVFLQAMRRLPSLALRNRSSNWGRGASLRYSTPILA